MFLEKRQECGDIRAPKEAGKQTGWIACLSVSYHCREPTKVVHKEGSLKLCLHWLRLSLPCLTPQQTGRLTQDGGCSELRRQRTLSLNGIRSTLQPRRIKEPGHTFTMLHRKLGPTFLSLGEIRWNKGSIWLSGNPKF